MKCRLAVVPGAVAVLGLACTSRAYEYQLQVPRKGFAVGEQFNPDGTVNGQFDYFTQSCQRYTCSPRTYSCLNGSWDAQGNLIASNLVKTIVTGSHGPDPCLVSGSVQYVASATTPAGTPANTEQVYAASGTSTTGHDTRGFGYVDVQASHYTWTTPQCHSPGCGQPIPFAPYNLTVTLQSDGDLPLNVESYTPTTDAGPAYYNKSGGTVSSITTDCSSAVAPGSSCSFQITYDPTSICTSSSYHLAYSDLYLNTLTDAGNLGPWEESFTITGTPSCGGN